MSRQKVFERIQKYLDLLGKDIVAYDKLRYELKVREKTADRDVIVEIRVYPEWVMGLVELGSIGEFENICELYRRMLQANFEAPEFVYSLHGDKIYAVMFVSIEALSLDVFYSEYSRLIHAYRRFIDMVGGGL